MITSSADTDGNFIKMTTFPFQWCFLFEQWDEWITFPVTLPHYQLQSIVTDMYYCVKFDKYTWTYLAHCHRMTSDRFSYIQPVVWIPGSEELIKNTHWNFTNNFSPTINIWWKSLLALKQILLRWSLQNCAHPTSEIVIWFNTFRPKQSGRHFPNDIFKWKCMNFN